MKNEIHFLSIIFSCALLGCNAPEKELLFEDEFNGTTLNLDYWNYELGDGCPELCGWGNNEKQLYTKKNVEVRDGQLVIRATHDNNVYESAKITTKNKIEFKYGTIEVRAKLATGQGMWSAIWLLGSNIDEVKWPACGEIDIMEYVGKEPQTIYTSLHTSASYGETINTKKTIHSNIENGFHTYKADWTANHIKFFVDGTQVYSFNPEDKNENTWPFDQPYYMIINMAIGGDFGGPIINDSIFPNELLIDYVRVYKNS